MACRCRGWAVFYVTVALFPPPGVAGVTGGIEVGGVQDRQVPLDVFVGRTAELARVAEVVTRMEAGEPWLVASEGDPGRGKTGSLTCQSRFRTCKPTTPAKHAITPLAALRDRVRRIPLIGMQAPNLHKDRPVSLPGSL